MCVYVCLCVFMCGSVGIRARVVAVVMGGQMWQFNGWPYKDLVSTFTAVRGFHVRFKDEIAPELVKASDLKTLILSQDKRYLDSSVAKEFWQSLEKFLLHNKRALIGLQ